MAQTPENIIGGGLDEEIVQQLNRRVQILGQVGFRDHDPLLYLGNKNCWIKMTSFTDVIASNEELKKLNDYFKGEYAVPPGTNLAKEWVLSGGISTAGDGVAIGAAMRYGLGTKDNFYGGAYGVGGIKELGYRPMPGIESLTVESLPPVGATYSATIKIKAWNLNQLSILDMLYFRLGFSCLVEWGHSVYIDKDDKVKTTIVQTLDAFSSDSIDDIRDMIQQKRIESDYNYDAMLGYITNYDWTQNRDGSYDCTVKLVGLGSLAESLKLNNQDNMPGTTQTSTSTATANQKDPIIIDSALKGFLTNIKSFALTNSGGGNQPPNLSAFIEEMKAAFTSGILNDLSKDKYFQHGYSRKYVRYRGKGSTASKIRALELKDFVTYTTLNASTTSGGKDSGNNFNTYIPLSLLLAYLNNSCLLYVDSKTGRKSVLNLDFHPDTSLCFNIPQQISVDPSVCLIDCRATTDQLQELLKTKEATDLSKITDPLPLTTGNTASDKVYAAGLSFTDDKVAYVGHTMNIFVNVDYLLKVYESTMSADKDKNVNLTSFLSTVLSGIAEAIGGINKFILSPDKDSSVISIIDTQNVYASGNNSIPVLPVSGLDGVTVREFSLKTEASSKLGSLLATTAMYNADLKSSGANIDGSGFVSVNRRLQDRIKRNPSPNNTDGLLTDPNSPFNSTNVQQSGTSTTVPQTTAPFVLNTPTSTTQALPSFLTIPALTVPATSNSNQDQDYKQVNAFNKYLTYAAGFSNAPDGSKITFDLDSKPGVINYYIKSLLNAKNSSKLERGTVTANGILPLSLNMTLDGISGIPLFEAFTLPGDRLPVQYLNNNGKPLVGFTVVGINHTIQGNQWTTSVRALMINIPEGSAAINQNAITRPTVKQAPPAPFQGLKKERVQELTVAKQNALAAQDDIEAIKIWIRENEGFKSVAEWDVDKFRLGYGSETITDVSGNVRNVKRGDTITLADAERDLQRKVTKELKPKTVVKLKSKGIEYNSLPLEVKILFVDLTYNYGNIFDGFTVGYIKKGKQGLIDELNRRIALGPGQVPARRKAEIILIS